MLHPISEEHVMSNKSPHFLFSLNADVFLKTNKLSQFWFGNVFCTSRPLYSLLWNGKTSKNILFLWGVVGFGGY